MKKSGQLSALAISLGKKMKNTSTPCRRAFKKLTAER